MSNLIEQIKVEEVFHLVKVKTGWLCELARGKTSLEDFVELYEQMNVVVLDSGQTSGNHIHLNWKDEKLIVVDGSIIATIEEPTSKQQRILEIPSGHYAIFPHGIAHRYENPSKTKSAVFLELATMAFNPNNPLNDTIPYEFSLIP